MYAAFITALLVVIKLRLFGLCLQFNTPPSSPALRLFALPSAPLVFSLFWWKLLQDQPPCCFLYTLQTFQIPFSSSSLHTCSLSVVPCPSAVLSSIPKAHVGALTWDASHLSPPSSHHPPLPQHSCICIPNTNNPLNLLNVRLTFHSFPPFFFFPPPTSDTSQLSSSSFSPPSNSSP